MWGDSMEQVNKKIAERLNKLLEAHNMTQQALADELKVSQGAVYFWCNGKKIPRMDKIDKIAELFNVKRSYILGLDDETQEEAQYNWADKVNNILNEEHKTTDIRQLQRIFAYASKILELPEDKIKQITDYLDFILAREDNK